MEVKDRVEAYGQDDQTYHHVRLRLALGEINSGHMLRLVRFQVLARVAAATRDLRFGPVDHFCTSAGRPDRLLLHVSNHPDMCFLIIIDQDL